MNRRDFLKATAFTSVALGFGGIGINASEAAVMKQKPANSLNVEFNLERKQYNSGLGSMYPLMTALRDESKLELSFLQEKFTDLEKWKKSTRKKLWNLIPEKVKPGNFDVELIEKVDMGEYIREKIYFNSTPSVRVSAYVLIPKNVKLPVPGLVCFHDHGGMYYWGKEKLVEVENEHPALTQFKKESYDGKSYASEFCKAGFAVIVIDAFFWGERRYISDEDVQLKRNDWKLNESVDAISENNQQSAMNEDKAARAIFLTGHTWQGLWLRDDIRSLDYLCSRPEVDSKRLGCVGLSIGGFRSAQFAGFESRIKCAIVDGWMTTYGSQLYYRPMNHHYPQYIAGAYKYVDLPDIVSMCAPNALMLIHGDKDTLFEPGGVNESFEKVKKIYAKAGCLDKLKINRYSAPHEFNIKEQADALNWLKKWIV